MDLTDVPNKVLKSRVKLYSAIYLNGQAFTAMVAHNNYLSFFDLNEWDWYDHKELEDEIIHSF